MSYLLSYTWRRDLARNGSGLHLYHKAKTQSRMANHLKKEWHIKFKIKQNVVYPAICASISLLVSEQSSAVRYGEE